MRDFYERLGDIPQQYRLVIDDGLSLERAIYFTGSGWYSMDDDAVYQAGEFATYSRIKIELA